MLEITFLVFRLNAVNMMQIYDVKHMILKILFGQYLLRITFIIHPI